MQRLQDRRRELVKAQIAPPAPSEAADMPDEAAPVFPQGGHVTQIGSHLIERILWPDHQRVAVHVPQTHVGQKGAFASDLSKKWRAEERNGQAEKSRSRYVVLRQDVRDVGPERRDRLMRRIEHEAVIEDDTCIDALASDRKPVRAKVLLLRVALEHLWPKGFHAGKQSDTPRFFDAGEIVLVGEEIGGDQRHPAFEVFPFAIFLQDRNSL